MKLKLLAILLALGTQGRPQTNYAVSTIPDSLKKNAQAVYRLDEASLKIESPSKFTYKLHQVVTLLNEEAKRHLYHQFYTDRFSKYDDIDIVVYDQEGKKLKKYNQKDFTKQAYEDGVDLVTDGKVMRLHTPAPGYPCTIEISYERNASSYIELPDWTINSPGEAVELSKFTVQVPEAIDIRHRTKGSTMQPVVSSNGGDKLYQWEARNITAKTWEPGAYTSHAQFPVIEVAPNRFSYDDYPGNFKTWADFGAWNYALYEQVKPFDDNRKAQINGLLQGAANDREKIARLYKYVQQNMRYVSIQLGIGGFKPFDVSYVDSKKYGDCKALTNYMRNLLKVAGIQSYPALVNAGVGRPPADPLFPTDPFNHVILCALADGDTTWLECTSNTDEPGKLGAFTENRYALLLTEQGGKLVPTPASLASDNRFAASTTIALGEDGTGSTQTHFQTTGSYTQEFIRQIGEEKKDDQKEYLMRNLGFLQPDAFDITFDKQVPVATARLTMQIEKIPSFTAGSKLFLPPRIYKLWQWELPGTAKRINDFYVGTPFVKTDTTLYRLPDGYGIDNLPQPKKINFDYGSFTSSYTWDAAQKAVVSIARFEITKPVIPAAKYAAAKSFFAEVLAEHNEKIVVKKL
jgi:hypothetical protein